MARRPKAKAPAPAPAESNTPLDSHRQQVVREHLQRCMASLIAAGFTEEEMTEAIASLKNTS